MLPSPRRFETDARYYVLCCTYDLWETLLVSRYWGGIGSRRGNQRHEAAGSPEAAQQRLTVLARERARHGYHEVMG